MLNVWDWLVVALYFVIIGVVAYLASRKQDTTEDYFLGGRNIGWFAIGASLFASNVGSEHIVGLAGQGATSGMAMAHWELHAWVLLMLGWVFVPFYYRSGVFTMPEFLERRFNGTARWILSLVSLAAYVFTKVSVTVYAGALVFQTLLPDTFGSPENAFWIGALATVVLTGVYTVFGGLRAVLYTDACQAVILLIGSVFITWFGLRELEGGWSGLREFVMTDVGKYALWRPLSDPDFPWLGVLVASPIIGIWYWCTDQYIVQRTLAAKNLQVARRGTIWGAFLKVWPVMIFLVPGMIGGALHKQGAIAIPLKAGVINGDQVFPSLVTSLLPCGLRGLVVAGLLAALMSSLSSLFNSSASLFTVDVYERIKPRAGQRELVLVGRIATCVIVGLGILWIPIMPLISQGGLYQYLQSVQGYLAPAITAVFLLGLFWPRINAAGAVWGLSFGFIAGMFKLAAQALFGAGKWEHPAWLAAIGDFNWLYATGVLFVLSVVVVVVASLLTAPPERARIEGLTYATIDRAAVRASISRWDVINTVLVLLVILGVYLYFSFWTL